MKLQLSLVPTAWERTGPPLPRRKTATWFPAGDAGASQPVRSPRGSVGTRVRLPGNSFAHWNVMMNCFFVDILPSLAVTSMIREPT
jgi:hypothetical protein